MAYADDFQLFISVPPSHVLTALTQLELCVRDVRTWLTGNQLSINDAKTEFIVFGTPQQSKKIPHLKLKVGDVQIPQSDHVRSLGVILDCNLNMKQQVSNACRGAFCQLRLISRIRRSLDGSTCALLSHSLVFSQIEYCLSLFHGINQNEKLKLQRVINSAIRMNKLLSKRDSVTAFHNQQCWMNVDKRVFLRLALLTFKTLKFAEPKYLFDLLQPIKHERNSRSQDQGLLATKWTRTEIARERLK